MEASLHSSRHVLQGNSSNYRNNYHFRLSLAAVQTVYRQTDRRSKEWAQLHVFQCMMKDVKMVEMEGPPRSHIHLVQSSWQALDFITLGTWPSSSVHNTVRIVINSVEECIDIGSLGIGASGFLRQEFHLIV